MSQEIKSETALCLRTVDKNHQSHHGFQWPKEPGSIVSAPDWNPTANCGNGLHGLLRGEGDGSLLAYDNPTTIWQVVEVNLSEVVEIDQKVKFPSCTLIYSGTKEEATALIKQRHPEAAVCFANVSVGDRKVAVVGFGGFATAGYYGTATAGHYGTATAGNGGTATAGDCGTATAGDGGTAMAGYYGTATAGQNGEIRIRYWDGNRYRTVCGCIGENGLEPNVRYRLDYTHLFVKASE